MESKNGDENSMASSASPNPPGQQRVSNAVAELISLASRVEQLTQHYAQLTVENRKLQEQVTALQIEKDQLVAKNEQLRNRIDTMVARLRDLERPL